MGRERCIGLMLVWTLLAPWISNLSSLWIVQDYFIFTLTCREGGLGHIGLCSEILPLSMLSDHSWWDSQNHMGCQGFQLELVVYKFFTSCTISLALFALKHNQLTLELHSKITLLSYWDIEEKAKDDIPCSFDLMANDCSLCLAWAFTEKKSVVLPYILLCILLRRHTLLLLLEGSLGSPCYGPLWGTELVTPHGL